MFLNSAERGRDVISILYIYKYIYIYIYVCVDHLKRCKTSNLLDDVLQWFSNLTLPFWLFHLIFQQKQGGKAFSDYLAQRSYVTEGEATGTPSCVPADSF